MINILPLVQLPIVDCEGVERKRFAPGAESSLVFRGARFWTSNRHDRESPLLWSFIPLHWTKFRHAMVSGVCRWDKLHITNKCKQTTFKLSSELANIHVGLMQTASKSVLHSQNTLTLSRLQISSHVHLMIFYISTCWYFLRNSVCLIRSVNLKAMTDLGTAGLLAVNWKKR